MTLVGVDESISSLELMEIITSQNPEVDSALQNGGTIKVLFSTQYGKGSTKRNVIFTYLPNVRSAIKKLNYKVFVDIGQLSCYGSILKHATIAMVSIILRESIHLKKRLQPAFIVQKIITLKIVCTNHQYGSRNVITALVQINHT